jgi:subtilisin family serine protease
MPEVTVFHRFDRFADVFVPPDNTIINKLASTPELIAMELDAVVDLPPTPKPALSKSRGEGLPSPEKIIHGGIDQLTGKGTIIAIVDSGVDFRNPDFIRFDDQGRPVSRLLYLWDTTTRLTNPRVNYSALNGPSFALPSEVGGSSPGFSRSSGITIPD